MKTILNHLSISNTNHMENKIIFKLGILIKVMVILARIKIIIILKSGLYTEFRVEENSISFKCNLSV